MILQIVNCNLQGFFRFCSNLAFLCLIIYGIVNLHRTANLILFCKKNAMECIFLAKASYICSAVHFFFDL